MKPQVFRLRASSFERHDEETEKPKRILFLSVEGARTEKNYFSYLNKHLNHIVVKIEVLSKRKGDSSVQAVIELIDEIQQLRDPNQPHEPLLSKSDGIASDQSPNAPEREERAFLTEKDLAYYRYLRDMYSDEDYFAVVLDRDCHSHTEEQLIRANQHCQSLKNTFLILSNPCFELWLLLHFVNVKEAYSEDKKKHLLQNTKVKPDRTYIQDILKNHVGSARKNITKKVFDDKYFPNIGKAIANASLLYTTFPELLNSLGTNMAVLFSLLKEDK